ncbi:hypothetical protein ROA7450_03319 [Roseovarius albus]|uniref:Uncharacterized protein n=1 Tax=Roseovarius albus TaxID=1247867 RepID=A0A1X6ZW66_9RHOB|nr:hypothetical protein ROA7450_03319 [Roseovarius albus]
MQDNRKPSQRRSVPEQLMGKREALFHLLRTPMRTATSKAVPAEPRQPRQVPKEKQQAKAQIVQTDDFIFRD